MGKNSSVHEYWRTSSEDFEQLLAQSKKLTLNATIRTHFGDLHHWVENLKETFGWRKCIFGT